jgi:hypothetical protein
MPHITRDSLMALEVYARNRADFRARVMAHKKNRMLHLGAHLTLIFEDELTVRYQVQEMLRTERIFEEEGIQDELDAYNPLIPDGMNWKATLMIEYPEEAQRRTMLEKLIGVEDRVWVNVPGGSRVYAIADEDMERENAEKTSAVHFLRFQLPPAMVRSLREGASLRAGVDHPHYEVETEAQATVRESLLGDLAS